MKSLSKFFIASMATAAMLSACSSKSATETEKVAPFVTETAQWADSATVGKSSVSVSIRAQYPAKGPSNLVNATRAWIAATLACSDTLIAGVHEHENDGNDLFKYVGGELIKESQADLRSSKEPVMEYEFMWDITAPVASDSCVTYTSNFYCYTGGAHGSTQVMQNTFDAQGIPFTTETMFAPESLDSLRQLVATNLANQYFHEANVDAMKANLILSGDNVPLPSTDPAFYPNGVRFVYQQYEIAPYSAGLPECTIPYSVIRPYLSPAAAALIP